jgi:hypothetical protein
MLLDACGKGLKAVKVELAFPITSAIAHLMYRISNNKIHVSPRTAKSLYAQVIPLFFDSYAAVSPLVPGPGCDICIQPATSSCTSTANRRYRILLRCESFLFLPDFITTRSPQPPLWPVRPRNFSNSRLEGSHIAQLSLSSARLRLFQPSRVSLKVPLRAMSVSFS